MLSSRRSFPRPRTASIRDHPGFRWLALALVMCCAVGCARLLPGHRQPAAVAPASSPAPPRVKAPASTGVNTMAPVAVNPPGVQLLGTVHVIGTGGRFVLVQAPFAGQVAGLVDGQGLTCRIAGNITATLRVSHERRTPFVVADVAAGTPNLGDEVFIEPPGSRMVSAPPPSPAPEFHANPAALPSSQ